MNDAKKLTLKFRAKTFYFASIFLPNKIRKDIENLYIFCRYIDDIGDSGNFSKKNAIKELEKIKSQIIVKKSDNLIISKFIYLQIKYRINAAIPIDLINGVKSDLNKVDFKNNKELLKYCYQVAGTVGYMFCKIIKINDTKLIFRGIQLGIAMQRTNISRDIREDLESDRMYLPKEVRQYKGEKKNIISSKKLKEIVSEDLLSFLEQTERFYQNSWLGIRKLPFKYAVPVSIAAELYQRIGNKIIRNNCNIWDKRIFLNKFEKVKYSFFALYKLFFLKTKLERKIDIECKCFLDNMKN